MTLTSAITAALAKARRLDTEIYIIFEDPDSGFELAMMEDLETYYVGAQVYHVVSPDGEVT